ncbi:unnamed protein product [Moneuplotes crassus]|uniref:Uncharacterized protein n=1 Tax=Euplotes crassus TaxID=5936 RepID=A0AAD1UA21_EUPCR|nr:unnamed protein product [Moneuplotes crassus]
MKTHKIIGLLNKRGFTSIQDKAELEDINTDIAQELAEWMLYSFGQDPNKFKNQNYDCSLVTIILLLKQCFIEINCKEIFDVNDILNPNWIRWREFICSFLHFSKFVDQTDKNEEELQTLKDELQMKKQHCLSLRKEVEALDESNEEFVLDEKEISLSDQLPVIESQHKSLESSKERLEAENERLSDKIRALQTKYSDLSMQLDQLKSQIVRSPEKIAKMEQEAKDEYEQIVQKNEALQSKRDDQVTLIYSLRNKVMNGYSLGQLKDCKYELQTKKSDLESKKSDLKQLKTEISQLETEISQLETEKKMIAIKNTNLQKTYQNLVEQKDMTAERINKLNSSIEEVNEEISLVQLTTDTNVKKITKEGEMIIDKTERWLSVFQKELYNIHQLAEAS